MLHQKLWELNLDLARSCLEHPFVEALGDGSLEAKVFSGYIAQDAFFLRAFVKAYALALARSEELTTMADFQGFIGGVIEELALHRAYATELGIDLERVVPNPACEAYTDFLLHTAWCASPALTLAAMTPCMRLYSYLGAALAPRCAERHPYRRWIETYSGKEFQNLTDRTETLLDRIATDDESVRGNYHYAMQCELDFFSEAMGVGI